MNVCYINKSRPLKFIPLNELQRNILTQNLYAIRNQSISSQFFPLLNIFQNLGANNAQYTESLKNLEHWQEMRLLILLRIIFRSFPHTLPATKHKNKSFLLFHQQILQVLSYVCKSFWFQLDLECYCQSKLVCTCAVLPNVE